MAKYLTHSEEETKKLAQNFAKKFKKGVIALIGELGAGKTTFVQGFAQGLGIKEKIISPTFVLIRQHQIPNSHKILFHVDLYRLENLQNLGHKEILSNSNNIVLIEWAEKAHKVLPKNTTYIIFEKLDQNRQSVKID